MEMYALTTGDISKENRDIFLRMSRIVESIGNIRIYGQDILSCHTICHALARFYDLRVVDGRFGTRFEHSWIELKNDKGDFVVADMYPVAGATPFLVARNIYTPWNDFYHEDPDYVARATSRNAHFDDWVSTVLKAVKYLDGELH